MDNVLFFQIAALVVLFNLTALLASLAIMAYVFKKTPAYMESLMHMAAGDEDFDLDDHYGDNPDVQFYTSPSKY